MTVLLGRTIRVFASRIPTDVGLRGRVIYQNKRGLVLATDRGRHWVGTGYLVTLEDDKTLESSFRRNIRRLSTKKKRYYYSYD